jgi:glyoxylase I family protein
MFTRLHHIAVICSNYTISRDFYTRVLGLPILSEVYREARDSHKLNLALPGGGELELFSFSNPPARLSRPEAAGLRHLAFAVADLDSAVARLATLGVPAEEIRVDELTSSRFTFIMDPDGLPIELYETPT